MRLVFALPLLLHCLDRLELDRIWLGLDRMWLWLDRLWLGLEGLDRLWMGLDCMMDRRRCSSNSRHQLSIATAT